MNADVSPLPFPARLWLAWVYFFRVLFDGTFAGRVRALDSDAAGRGNAPAKHDASEGDVATRRSPSLAAPSLSTPSTDAALQLLGLLQREGRLIDFCNKT